MVSKPEPVGRRTKLPLRDGVEDCMVGDGREVESVGVFVPEEIAESPPLAGVEGGGSGPEGESENVDQGRGRSGPRWCL